jgi:tetratricopeptide (TPR) repeat protein
MWKFQTGSLGLLLGIVALSIGTPLFSAQAQVVTPGTREPEYPKILPPDPKRIPPNPLEDETPDPLFPDRTLLLGELGRAELRLQLDEMSQVANQLFAQKKGDAAFKLWFRELRLRRILGDREEIFALARIGEIAWQNNRTRDLRDMTERLQRIQMKLSKLPDTVERAELNEYLALSYQVVRSPQLALSIYEPRLQQLRDAQADLKNNPLEAFKTLNSIGLIHLDWFRYEKASRTYGELVQLARLTQDRSLEALYLIQLTYIAEQRRSYKEAIASLETLITLYSSQPEIQPALHLRLAENQDADRAFDAAEKTYQKAFTLSQTLSQSSYGSTALFKLADLYRRTDRPANAAQVYDYLVDAEQAVYNLHNAMKAADLLGQMRSQQKDYRGAIEAYERAGAIASALALKSEPLQKRLEAARKSLTTTPKS